MPTEPRIVPARTLGDPRRLEPLARQIFGPGDRPAGWFSRKLRRERVDPDLSPVAIEADAPAHDPAGWLGYVLVGTPPSRGDAVRTAGTGVQPRARGQGVGGRLLETVIRWSRDAGYRRVELLAEHATLPFYRRHGFSSRHPTVTAVAFGHGTRTAWVPPPPWGELGPQEHEPVAWLPETWAGTERTHRRGLRWPTRAGPVTAWISQEGVAWLVQRLVAPRSVPLTYLAATLRAQIPLAAPLVLPLLPADAPQTRALLDMGWSVAQRGALLECRLDPRIDLPTMPPS
ncbi:MAG: GNAT family N-acetyltransferase [Myxococcota bacterium]